MKPEETGKPQKIEEEKKEKQEKIPIPPAASALKPEDELDAIKGCLMGGFCGDAAGSPFEFSNHLCDDNVELELGLDMNLGNIRWDGGQGTDDSELTLALAQGLCNGKGNLNLVEIIKMYGR